MVKPVSPESALFVVVSVVPLFPSSMFSLVLLPVPVELLLTVVSLVPAASLVPVVRLSSNGTGSSGLAPAVGERVGSPTGSVSGVTLANSNSLVVSVVVLVARSSKLLF